MLKGQHLLHSIINPAVYQEQLFIMFFEVIGCTRQMITVELKGQGIILGNQKYTYSDKGAQDS